MSSTTQSTDIQIDTGRIWWAGLLAIVSSVVVNLIIRAIAIPLFNISPGFLPLARPGMVVFLTTVLVGAGVVVYYIVARRSSQPIRTFRTIVIVVLLISYLPDLRLLLSGRPGATVLSVGTLMLMHAAAAGISYNVLTRLTRKESAQSSTLITDPSTEGE